MIASPRSALLAALVALPCACTPSGGAVPAPVETGVAPSPASSWAAAPSPSPAPAPTIALASSPSPSPKPPASQAGPCGFSPTDWCPAPPGDPCGAHRDTASCKADMRCQGMRYRGESLVACHYDERGFAGNCPTVGCISR